MVDEINGIVKNTSEKMSSTNKQLFSLQILRDDTGELEWWSGFGPLKAKEEERVSFFGKVNGAYNNIVGELKKQFVEPSVTPTENTVINKTVLVKESPVVNSKQTTDIQIKRSVALKAAVELYSSIVTNTSDDIAQAKRVTDVAEFFEKWLSR